MKRWAGIAMVGSACGVLADSVAMAFVTSFLMVLGLILWIEP